MTHVVVISDTHMPRVGRALPPIVMDELQRADLILHLGDVTQESVLRDLESIAPVRAVWGNNDSEELRLRLPERDSFDLHGHRFAMLHGHLGGRTAREAALKVRDADVVLFGHSHRAWQTWDGDRLYLNPGSPTDPRWSPSRAFAVIDVDETVRPRIVPIDTP